MKFTRILASATIFTVIAILSRVTLRHTETRWQIVGLWIVAAVVQFVLAPMIGRRPSFTILAVDMLCVAVACAAVKVAIEGAP